MPDDIDLAEAALAAATSLARSRLKLQIRIPESPSARMGCTYCAGARVRDTITGLDGEVLGATIRNLVTPATRSA